MDGIDHRDDQKNALPAGFTVRRARPSDAAAVTALVATSQEELHGEAEVSKASVLAKWQAPRFDLNRDAWLIETEAASTGGRSAAGPAKAPLVVAFGAVRESSPGQFEGNLTVHPRFAGRGLGAYVLARLEERVREAAEGESDGSAVLHTWSSSADTAEVALYLASGFERVAAFSRMEKEFGTDTEAPMWPPGIEPAGIPPGRGRPGRLHRAGRGLRRGRRRPAGRRAVEPRRRAGSARPACAVAARLRGRAPRRRR